MGRWLDGYMDAWMGGWLDEYTLMKDRRWPPEPGSSQQPFEPGKLYFLGS